MADYTFTGFYEYLGSQGELDGELTINSEGVFQGEITDHSSMAPFQKIKGQFVLEDKVTKLMFLKFPPSSELANLMYGLVKESRDVDFTGLYKGKWHSLPDVQIVTIDLGNNGKLQAAWKKTPMYAGGENTQLEFRIKEEYVPDLDSEEIPF